MGVQRAKALIFLCFAQRKNMEIFLFVPNGIGTKFGFSLHAQIRTEKLPRGCINCSKTVKKFRIEPFLKGAWVSRGQSPRFAPETDSHTFSQLPTPSKSKRRITRCRFAVDEVRSAGSELLNSPGDCWAREGRSARESAPLKRDACNSIGNGIAGIVSF